MACSCSPLCKSTAKHFGAAWARRELASYHRKGPGKTTRRLLKGLEAAGARPATILDIGSGIGTLSIELLRRGAGSATCVDMSSESQAIGAEEARRQGLADRIEWHTGDFVGIAGTLPPAEVVTLDRVVCCYPSYQELLGEAAAHSRQFVAMSYPRDWWVVRVALWVENAWLRLRGETFRAFVHSIPAMASLLEQAGFRRVHHESTVMWEAAVFARSRE